MNRRTLFRHPEWAAVHLAALVLLTFALALFSGTRAVIASPDYWKREWPRTDFSITSVDHWDEIFSGGPPRDGIPALADPKMVAANSEKQLAGNEPVVVLELDGAQARAYPLRYLTWHEIVNDWIPVTGTGNSETMIPVAVTFCPLCNSALSFDRRIGDQALSFGVTGKLRNSDLVMYDAQTESWWQQATGTAIVGTMTGVELVSLPSWLESWDEFRARNPEHGLVMDQPGHLRPYGSNPYAGYDTSKWPFLYRGEAPPHGIAPLARVVRVDARAWPLERIARSGRLSEGGVNITWKPGQASALDTQTINKGRDVGSIRVRRDGVDIAHDVMFAFAFHAFWPDGEWMLD